MYSKRNYDLIYITNRATSVANWLIKYYEVQAGYGLSHFLGVNPACQNHEAIRIWVQLQMAVLPKRYFTLGELRKAFESLLPIEVFL